MKSTTTVILYDAIERKNILEREMFKALSPKESLIQSLNLMDFMAAFQSRLNYDEGIQWIVLELKQK